MCSFEGTYHVHEWLSGGVSPCQGEGRGFESRLVLFLIGAEAFVYKDFRCFCMSSDLKTVEDSCRQVGFSQRTEADKTPWGNI